MTEFNAKLCRRNKLTTLVMQHFLSTLSFRNIITAVLLSVSLAVAAQSPKDYSGQVHDENGEPMAGVMVNVIGSNVHAVTDGAGVFTIKAADGQSLEFSFIGYENKRVVLNRITAPMIVAMNPQPLGIDEVVVVGYGSARKRDLTGAIASVKAEEIEAMPSSNAFEALNGKVPGMKISMDPTPGGAANIQIRGIGSFGDASPVCVIDGQFFEVDALSMISSSDIESISVLKDASATAIYGSRGANGVIIVTTKSGESDGGATTVRVGAWVSVAEIERKLNVMNLSQYQQMKNLEYLADNWNKPDASSGIPYPDWKNAGAGTDWQDYVTRLAVSENADVSISGGNKKFSFFLSSAFLNQQGVVKYSDYNRYSARLNVSYTPVKWFRIGVNSMFTYDNRTNAENTIFQLAGKRLPDAPLYVTGDDGEESFAGGSSNPVALLEYTHDRYNKVWNYSNNIFVEINFLKNLQLRSSISNTTRMGEEKSFIPPFMENVENANEYIVSQFRHNTVQNRNWMQENTLTYTLDKKGHRLTAMAGCTFQSMFNQYANLSATELPWSAWKNRNLWYVGQGKNITGADGGSEKTYASFFARATYTYKNRYTATLTGRYDGSSVYPKDNQFGFFPSVGFAWTVSQEKFMKRAKWMDLLKLRASWGVVGNDKGVSNAQALYASPEYVVMGPDNEVNTVNALKLMYDSTLTWESSRTFNVGLDFSLFNRILSGSVDYYDKVTGNVMMPLNIQPSNIQVTSNIGSVLNRGVEGTLTIDPHFRTVKTSFSFTASANMNKVLKIRSNIGPISNIPNQTIEGYPIGGLWTYETIGVYQNEAQLAQLPKTGTPRVGDLIYRDVNGDGLIDQNDYVFQGSYMPKAHFGFTAKVEYKGAGLSVDLTAAVGHVSFNERFRGRQPYQNGFTQQLQAWTGEGSTNVHPRIFGLGDSSALYSDYFIEKCDYLSLYNAQIYYNLPRRFCNKIKMKSLKVYVNGKNLYTFTGATGYSPEIMPRGNNANSGGLDRFGLYPNNRTFTFGVQVSF